jgi:hypothetical protein
MDASAAALGGTIVRATIWLALLCYVAGPAGAAREPGAAVRSARIVWTVGCAAYLLHVASAFEVFYRWSHRVAVDETARQVAELTGRALGAGLWLNYLFTLVWVVDALAWWRDAVGYRRRSVPRIWLLHGFFLFMIANATVLFGQGAVRALGLVVTGFGFAATWSAARRRRAMA